MPIPPYSGVHKLFHLSRSPDSRIISNRTAFSGMIPMADFRRVRRLHAYSGGTVPDSNRIVYSPPAPVEAGGTQMSYSIFHYLTTANLFCQSPGRLFQRILMGTPFTATSSSARIRIYRAPLMTRVSTKSVRSALTRMVTSSASLISICLVFKRLRGGKLVS